MCVFGFEAVVLADISAAAWYNIGLALVLCALAVAGVMAYRMWQEMHEEIDPATPEELLASFEQARAEGELDEEEYARVQSRLQKNSLNLPGAKPSQPARREDPPAGPQVP